MSYPLEPSEKGSGLKIYGMAGEDLKKKSLTGMKGSHWFNINSTAVSSYPILGITCEKVFNGRKGEILLYGLITDNKWNWEPGKILYASEIPGEMTQIPPPVQDIMPEMGVACTPKCVVFAPQRFAPRSLLEGIPSNPEDGGVKVTNLFVINDKLKVEYEV